MMQRFRWFAKLSVLGALLFWLPSIIVHMLAGERFSGKHVLILSLLLPTLTLSLLILTALYEMEITRHKLSLLVVMFGIWFFAPLCISISSTFAGGGLAEAEGWLLALVGTLLFPIFTLLLSTYDGTLFAVLLTTLGLLLLQALYATLGTTKRQPLEE